MCMLKRWARIQQTEKSTYREGEEAQYENRIKSRGRRKENQRKRSHDLNQCTDTHKKRNERVYGKAQCIYYLLSQIKHLNLIRMSFGNGSAGMCMVCERFDINILQSHSMEVWL